MPFSGPLGERQLISELIADYCDAVNRRDDVAWGATWDEDSVWSLPFLGIEGIRGRANIVSTWKQAMGLFSFAHMMAQAGPHRGRRRACGGALLHRRGHGSRRQRRRAATLRSV
jgi:ketosteroid isomerase-like protein